MPDLSTTATITSKMQLTIPMKIATKIGIKVGEKLQVSEHSGQIILTPVKKLLHELAGSLSTPTKWKNKNIEFIIQDAKRELFKSKDI